MNKMAAVVGLLIILTLFSVDTSVAECSDGFSQIDSDPHDGTNRIRQADYTDKDVSKDIFKVPAGVHLFLSAIAGLGVVSLRGRMR